MASVVAGGGNGAIFSSFIAPKFDCFLVAIETFACFFGLSGVIGRALSRGLSAIITLNWEFSIL